MIAPEPQPKKDGVLSNPFWLPVIVLWVLLVCAGITLALALGIWNLWQAF